MLYKIDDELKNLDDTICRHIDNISRDSRGEVSQDVLSDLRHYVEHIMFKICYNGKNLDVTYDNIQNAKKYISSNGEYKFLMNFHKMLQIVVSHYKPNEENSERLMLKYYEYLFKIREAMEKYYNMNLLHNLEKFPLNMDPKLMEYYQKIANEIDKYKSIIPGNADRFYIHKVKPFFINKKIYYEVTFSPANDYSSKTDRIIAFTKIPIDSNYASKMKFVDSSIEIMGHKMPILIIVECGISIRKCEFNNFVKLIKGEKSRNVTDTERTYICSYMTMHKVNLLDIINFSNLEYTSFKTKLTVKSRVTTFLNVLDICRNIINSDSDGANILSYLLFTMNNTVIKNQYDKSQNTKLSNLYITNRAIPFDHIPFSFSLKKHNPPFNILINCFDVDEHKSEILARYIKNNTECNGKLFTSLKDIDVSNEEIQKLMDDYNSKLWNRHKPDNELKIDKGQIFIRKYVKDCRFIIDKLKELTNYRISNYTNSVNAWLNDGNNGVDCEEKKEVLKKMFANSTVSLLYGAAGTGKTTLINHISQFFYNRSKLFLAQTNPAVDNLKRKVKTSDCHFMTVKKFILNKTKKDYNILIIDECSTISNSDMRKILEQASFSLLILVGDTYQIESIRFGNWFNVAKRFLPDKSLAELTKKYRSNDLKLLSLWDKVRKMDLTVLEALTKGKYSNRLDNFIFQKCNKDEIILCLNYDGLYGINNINRFLQEMNPSKLFSWGIQTFKVGDPILFHDTDRFSPVIYNNMKGQILNISIFSSGETDERIEFDIELDKIINGMDVIDGKFELLEHNIYKNANNSVIRFSVYKNDNTDNDDFDSSTIIPFQVLYAISIHKAQGLEYNSVKIVITNEIDEMITHNIFYTAITRAKSHLQIYWSPEVENKVLSMLKPKNNNKDVELLYKVEI